MSYDAVLSLLTALSVGANAPTWAPLVFATGAFVVVVLVLIMVRQKLKQSESWKQDPENPGTD